jgi:RsiW-degrading membrane proteinase PrsW (M82 family)
MSKNKTETQVNVTSKGAFILIGAAFIITAGVAIVTAFLSIRSGEWTHADIRSFVDMTILAVFFLIALIVANIIKGNPEKDGKQVLWKLSLIGMSFLAISGTILYFYIGDWRNFNNPLVWTILFFANLVAFRNSKKKAKEKKQSGEEAN